MIKVVGIRFQRAGKIYYFDPLDYDLETAMHVIVETARGIEMGTVLIPPKEVDDDKVVQPLKPVIRIATDDDEKVIEKNKEKEVEYFANYDFLTNLPNRRMFDAHFRKVLDSLENNQKYLALLFLDLDKFKLLNDSKGHDYGDLLLKEFSSRLKKSIRNIDFVARLGGDEFVIILDNLPNNIVNAKNICEKISSKIVENTREKFILDDYEYNTSTSIGVYIFNDFNESMDNIIKKSDEALYDAKKSGKDRYSIFFN